MYNHRHWIDILCHRFYDPQKQVLEKHFKLRYSTKEEYDEMVKNRTLTKPVAYREFEPKEHHATQTSRDDAPDKKKTQSCGTQTITEKETKRTMSTQTDGTDGYESDEELVSADTASEELQPQDEAIGGSEHSSEPDGYDDDGPWYYGNPDHDKYNDFVYWSKRP